MGWDGVGWDGIGWDQIGCDRAGRSNGTVPVAAAKDIDQWGEDVGKGKRQHKRDEHGLEQVSGTEEHSASADHEAERSDPFLVLDLIRKQWIL